MLLIPNVRLIFWTVIWKEHLVELLPKQSWSYVHFNSSWLTSHQQSQKPWILTSQHIDNPYPSYPYLEHFLRTYQFTKYHNLRCLRRQLSLKLVAFSYHLSTMNLTQHKQPNKKNRWTVWAPLAWPRNSIANWDSPQITHGGIPAVVNHLKPTLPGQAPRFEEHPANQVSPSKTCPPLFFSFWGVNFMSETNWARFRTFVSLWENIVWTKEPLPKNIHHMSQKFYINKDLDLFWFSSPAFHFRTKLPPSDLKSSWHYRTFFGTNC